MPLAFSLGVLVPAMTSPVNYGVRHVLPIYLGFSLIAARGVLQMMEWARSRKLWGVAALALGVWIVVSGASHHPDYLAYTNEFVASHPENVMVDSDLDWG